MTPKGVCPEGLRRVPVSAGAQFLLLQPSPKRPPTWEPKWSVLGAKVVTILLFVRPCRENRPSKNFNFLDMISKRLGPGGAPRGGLARPEGGYIIPSIAKGGVHPSLYPALDNPPIAWCLYFERGACWKIGMSGAQLRKQQKKRAVALQAGAKIGTIL